MDAGVAHVPRRQLEMQKRGASFVPLADVEVGKDDGNAGTRQLNFHIMLQYEASWDLQDK